jgi:hypothetical protein
MSLARDALGVGLRPLPEAANDLEAFEREKVELMRDAVRRLCSVVSGEDCDAAGRDLDRLTTKLNALTPKKTAVSARSDAGAGQAAHKFLEYAFHARQMIRESRSLLEATHGPRPELKQACANFNSACTNFDAVLDR